MLESVPHQNVAASAEDRREGGVVIRIPTRKPWFWVPPFSWVVPSREEQVVVLDATGSFLWRLCDGTRTVEEVVETFAERYRFTFHEARAAVTPYLKNLIQRGVLAMAIPVEDE